MKGFDYYSVLLVLANLAARFPVLLIRDVYPRSCIPDPNFFHPGSLIPDPIFFHPGSWILDPHQRNFSILTKKNDFSALRNMIRVFHPGSGSWIGILTFYPSRILILYPRSRIQGSKRPLSPDPGSGFATLEISDLLRL